MEIFINLKGVKEAARSLRMLKEKLNSADSNLEEMNCITESSGSTFNSVNDAYRQLKYIESSLKKLLEKTEISLENVGIKVTTTDSDLVDIYNEMIDPNNFKMPWLTQQTKSVEGNTTTTIVR